MSLCQNMQIIDQQQKIYETMKDIFGQKLGHCLVSSKVQVNLLKLCKIPAKEAAQ